MRECDHRVAERKGLRNDRIRRGSKIEVAGKPFEHRAVHTLFAAAAHLIPVIARHLQLGLHGHLHLRHREQVFKAGFSGHFLKQKPFHLLGTRVRGDPRK